MTAVLTIDKLVASLRTLGIGVGDIVHVQSDLRRIGLVDAPLTRDGVCGFYLAGLQATVGPTGTVTTCTSFEDYGRHGTPFVREESPSRTDTLSEFIRTRPGALRSMHPIVSVTGLGPAAEAICGGSHFDGFGYQSPWARLHRAGAKILSLGLGANVEGGMTFLHYVEHLYGVPYQYTKVFGIPVFSGGREIRGPFTMSVRYLDFGIVNEPFRIKRRLLDEGAAREVRVGRAPTWCADARSIVDHTVRYFDEDRWIYLREPPTFRRGEVPADGPVGSMQIYYNHSA